ncbi:MAG: immunoglobulin domain-containing protein, partial [Limisphaerales bacterium]
DPAISSPPANTTVAATGTAHFSVAANGTGSLTYQWKKAGSNLSNGTQGSGSVVSGATTSALTISGVQQADAANYTVVVTGTGGTITSSPGALTVTDVAPVFSTPTVDSTITQNAGDTVVLNAAATGTTPISYQWKKGVNNLSDGAYANGATVSGATTGSLTLSGLLASDAGVYTCDAHNSVNDSLSHTTTINVNDPVISVQPVSFTAGCGDAWPCLSVTAIGSTNLTYQWYTPGPGGTAIADATNATLCFNDNSFASAGSYSVVVSNGFGNSITSSVATVTVTDTNAPSISLIGPHLVNVCQGSLYTEQGATATDGCDGGVAATPSGTVNTNTVGTYTVTYTATDSHGNIAITNRIVNVQTCFVGDPAITSQPANQTVVVGQTGVTFNVAVSGTPSSNPKLAGTGGFHYQWSFIPKATGLPKPMAGKTNASLTLSKIALGSAGTYYCVVTNSLSSATSDYTNFGKLTVFDAPTASGPANVTKVAGNIAIFKVTASPSAAVDPSLGGPFTFQWNKNGVPISTGGNITISNNGRYSSLIIDNIQTTDAATYRCTVGNSSAVPFTTLNDGKHGVLNVLGDDLNPKVSITHPTINLHYTNGLPALNTGSITQPGNIAPQLDIDGTATDKGRITDITLVRLQDTNIYNVAFVYRTNSSGAMLPGSAKWTNHVVLIDGTNTFQAFATNTYAHFSNSVPPRTYYMCTPVTVTINVQGTGKITPVATPFGKTAQGVNTLFNQLAYKVTATKTSTKKAFQGWYDGNSQLIAPATVTTLSFTATNNMVINAVFQQ